jgi:hypothetical protein
MEAQPYDNGSHTKVQLLPPSHAYRRASAPQWLLKESSMADVQDPKANQPGGQLEHVYFPTTSIVSLLYVMEDGASAEIAIVGREGIVGIAIFMGGETTPSRAIVQSAGQAYRLLLSARRGDNLARISLLARRAKGVFRDAE